MKIYCKTCNHLCHCVGKGYYVSESFCDSCGCNECTCNQQPLLLTKPRSNIFEYTTIVILITLILLVNLL